MTCGRRALSHLPLRLAPPRSYATSSAPPWRPSSVLDEWVRREARPISLRQLTFFGARLTETRLLGSANYVRTELPTRIAHRLRDMQTLPYAVVTNPHLSHVYELYYRAFERYRRVPEIKTLEDNDHLCQIIKETVNEHLTVIPRLAIGVLEVQGSMKPEETDKFMTTLLRSRISRRTIAEQHLALTETFHSPWHFPEASSQLDPNMDSVGEIFLKCNAKEIVEQCANATKELMLQTYGSSTQLPEVKIEGHTHATFPYILSHLEYIVGELLRNSIQAVIEQRRTAPPPIEVLICETQQHVIIRISDQGGGVPKEVLPYLWSFSKGPRRKIRLENLQRVPKLAATTQEVKPLKVDDRSLDKSLTTLTSRPPDLRLGIGLPMSRIYAEYWAGSLELHSLEGYGVDVFLQISKLGNKNEQLTTRASMDAV
ncbi:uncharacterized protein K452DRAFT_299694 [Aplosporella prunicola CBS 121167]|uniref:Protein-serine/threonine kinase n=1 Tax=Aplosporella prunicola CBS 121167 TaxID=1176127 RepID=A0A6A6BCX2_9PEZI|nr:uncharacterized protein K452DRAFT_299694 [Aplosporella prunicola CBS 121167]KAF2140341.1 hypothetical protein K452DRAFT_299694 [Aplosporella prunicola CBS 121167]